MPVSARREDLFREASAEGQWDYIVVGGGATGLGTALEAVSRGYRTLLLEAEDFAKATSSRSTKLVHGGVRYLRQGNVKLVLEALRERGRMLRNAPHLAHRQAFVVPAYSVLDLPFYGVGLTLYDSLAGKEGLGRSRVLGRQSAIESLPGVRAAGLRGGILYYDGQFDDARFAIALLRTFLDLGGIALNYTRVTGLLKSRGKIAGVTAEDGETRKGLEVRAKAVINATGIFSDGLRRMDEAQSKPMLTVSQGTHFVLPRHFLPGNTALMIPKTSDGRVLFAIPWHDHVVVGTTDSPVPAPQYEPHAMSDEKTFLASNIERFLGSRPKPDDVLSMWSGQRPLVRQADKSSTAAISRDHTILISSSNLVTITGGKWTTYRRMAQDVIDRTMEIAGLAASRSVTVDLRLHGWIEDAVSKDGWEQVYGADLPELKKLGEQDKELGALLHPRLPFRKAEIVWAARHEMARTAEDVLARRTRALFLDARASLEAVPEVARIMAATLARDERWQAEQVRAFENVARDYIWNG
ncbi:MAG: glycerol-3-phosphate dehydrogenase/oxidase [Acidobacteriota bacterium]|nr:glycerol-3-phosphate dehydrogenase/oxidase [Acidobacteriota bacterium]